MLVQSVCGPQPILNQSVLRRSASAGNLTSSQYQLLTVEELPASPKQSDQTKKTKATNIAPILDKRLTRQAVLKPY